MKKSIQLMYVIVVSAHSYGKVEYSHAQKTRIHINRVVGSNRHYCASDGHFNAGPAAGQKAGPNRLLP
jgi:hypothetical protein